jgi:DNA-binding NarL/FixJ family response regulator
MTIRVLLADDQALLRQTFRLLIDSCPDLDVVGEAADGREAIAQATALRPDVVVMDIRMPGIDGLAATVTICNDPDLAQTRVLVLTTFETDEYVAKALRAGASGFLGKDVSSNTLLSGIRTVAAGDALLSPQATRSLIARFLATSDAGNEPARAGLIAHLTPREREVTALAAEGFSNDDIADKLYVSPLTVRTHIQRSMNKLHARDRAQLVVFAYQSGLVKPTAPTDATGD